MVFAEALFLEGLALLLFLVDLVFADDFPLEDDPPELLLALLLDLPFDLSDFAKAAPPRSIPDASGSKGGAKRNATAIKPVETSDPELFFSGISRTPAGKGNSEYSNL
ncbi:MAG: hypothetical protein ACSHXD_17270 [Marinosulfonomonas sp.]